MYKGTSELNREEIISEIESIANPIEGTNLTLPQSEFASLDGRFRESVVVALGESTHGTHEFYQMKHRLFRYLVEKHGFTIFALEDLPESCAEINAYIQGGKGEGLELIRRLYPIYQTQEYIELIEWMREYNKNYQNVLSFAGIDMNAMQKAQYDGGDYSISRDEVMADTVIRLTRDNSNAKVLLAAHNAHIKATGTISEHDVEAPMGSHLREYYGRKFLSIAQLFGKGSVSAESVDKGKRSGKRKRFEIEYIPDFYIESVLQHVAFVSFLIDMSLTREGSELYRYLHTRGFIRSIGWGIYDGMYNGGNEVVLGEDYDCFWYYNSANASVVV